MSKTCLWNNYIPILWDYNPSFEAIKGHVTRDEFEAILTGEGLEGKFPTLQYLYARWIPVVGRDYDLLFHIEQESKRGNFPVTIGEYK